MIRNGTKFGPLIFSVVTDAGEKRGREVPVKFEQMRAVFGALLTKAEVNLLIPQQIVAFRNTKEFPQFVPPWHGKPTQLAGLFLGASDRSFILLDMSVEDRGPWCFMNTRINLLNGNITGPTQPWFDEGFAEYFSTVELAGCVLMVCETRLAVQNLAEEAKMRAKHRGTETPP